MKTTIICLHFLVVLVSLIVSFIGGSSLWFEFHEMKKIGLDWDFSCGEGYVVPLWIKTCWPILVLLAPLTMRSGFFGLVLYCFASFSIQGSERMSRCLHNDGFIDWLLLLLLCSYSVGELSSFFSGGDTTSCWFRESSIPIHKAFLHPAFLAFLSFLIWIFFTYLFRFDQQEKSASLYYRRPFLWAHCALFLFASMRELDSNARRLLLLGFLLFTLLWRVATTSDSVWLEGHFASYLVLVLPWTLFSTHSQSENGKRFFLFLYTVLFIVWFLGPSFDFKLSFYASDLSNRYGFPGLVAPVAALMAFFLTVSRHLFFRIYFFLSSAFMSLGILLISNRASALASMACVIMYVVLSPVSIALRVIGLFLSVIAVAMASWYAPLADRFRNMASEGSGKERLELWRVAWELTLENPWFGVGPGQFPNLVRSRSTQIDAQLDVHNSWLEVLCETGIPGVFFFSLFWLIVVIASFISFFRSRRVIDNTQEIESPRSLGDPSTWLFRSTWVFVCVYFVVGFFGSRHNLPLAYLLAGVGLSACLNAGSKPLRPDALDYAATA